MKKLETILAAELMLILITAKLMLDNKTVESWCLFLAVTLVTLITVKKYK